MAKLALLLSGGIESTCLAWRLRPDVAITIDYGQVSSLGEIQASKSVCEYLELEHRVISAKTNFVRSGLLAGAGGGSVFNNEHPEFWPYRNQFIITCALMALFSEPISKLAIGAVANDSKFSDGTPGFIEAINALVSLQKREIQVIAPALSFTSSELLASSKLPKQLVGLTFSCHSANIPCGVCPGCMKNRSLLSSYYDL